MEGTSLHCASARRCTGRRAARIFRYDGGDDCEAVEFISDFKNCAVEMDWHDLAEDGDRCRDFVNAAMNLRVS
jgi:hypothetical protein